MGKKNRNKGFFKFNRGRFVKSVLAAVVLTVIVAEILWNGYYFPFMGDDYDDHSGLPEEARITSLNLLAYAVLGDESFLKEALSGPVAYDYISFKKVDYNGKTPIYETEYVERIPELEGAKADYNTRYQVLNYLFGSNQYMSSRLKTYLKVPEYNSIPYSLVPFTEEEFEQIYSYKHITLCRASEKLLENKATDLKLRHAFKHYYYDYIRFYGILSLNGKKYEYDMIVNFKSFAEFATLPLICAFLLNLSICLAIGFFTGLRKYRKYQTEINNISFKNGLIDALAHNLKTPMQIITVNAENIKDRPSAERKKKYIDTILSRSKVMNDMIDTINGAVKRTPVESVFGVKDAVNEAADKLSVRLEISDDTNIKADREYFIQAVYNLIDNAAQYGLEGFPIKVDIKPGKMIISNHTESDKFTPGTGLAIADRFLTRTGMLLTLELDDGVFKAVIEFGFY